MSPSVITVETHEDFSHKLIIQRLPFGCLYGVISGWLGIYPYRLMLGALTEIL